MKKRSFHCGIVFSCIFHITSSRIDFVYIIHSIDTHSIFPMRRVAHLRIFLPINAGNRYQHEDNSSIFEDNEWIVSEFSCIMIL